MWVITREINDYRQDGQYFVAAYIVKPTLDQLIELTGSKCGAVNLIENGGGRVDLENEWFFLDELIDGQTLQFE